MAVEPPGRPTLVAQLDHLGERLGGGHHGIGLEVLGLLEEGRQGPVVEARLFVDRPRSSLNRQGGDTSASSIILRL